MSKGVDTSVDFAGWALRSPLTTASGTFGSGDKYAPLWQAWADGRSAARVAVAASTPAATAKPGPFDCLGALTTKGVSAVPWAGNSGIRIAETASGMLNSIGLENPGVEDFIANDLAWLASQDVPVIVNVSGHSIAEYIEVIGRLEAEPAVWAYELNISCPNIDGGGMSFGVDPQASAEVTAAARASTMRPLIVKLTPNVTDIAEVALAVEAAGADALSLINTLAGMAIDIQARQPVFERVVAGLSGPAVKPVALWAVYRAYQAVAIPLIGMGGVTSAGDVVEFMLAGASLVGVGSASFTDPTALPQIHADLVAWCQANGVQRLQDLIGAVHG